MSLKSSKIKIFSLSVLTTLMFVGCIEDDTVVNALIDDGSASYTTREYDDGRFDFVFTIESTGLELNYYEIVDRSDIDGSFLYIPKYMTPLSSTTLSCTPTNEQSFSCVDSATTLEYTLTPNPELYLLKRTVTSDGTSYSNALETITANGLQ